MAPLQRAVNVTQMTLKPRIFLHSSKNLRGSTTRAETIGPDLGAPDNIFRVRPFDAESRDNIYRRSVHVSARGYVCIRVRNPKNGIRTTANRAIPSRAHLARTSSSYRYITNVRVVEA